MSGLHQVYQCKNCGVAYEYDPYDCDECESIENFEEVLEPEELMILAEKNLQSVESKHIYADLALFHFVKSINPELAERYEKISKIGFYFA